MADDDIRAVVPQHEHITMTLTEFLTARLDEDEVMARAAQRGGEGRWSAESDLGVGAVIDTRREIVAYDEGRPDEHQAAHIARHDPAHVLAEVNAKRQIIGYIEEVRKNFRADPRVGHMLDGPIITDLMLQQLALPYADHPDYDQNWKP